MALTHNFKKPTTNSSFNLSDIGSKVRNVAEIVGAVKGLYDTGKVIYQGAKVLAPIVAGFV